MIRNSSINYRVTLPCLLAGAITGFIAAHGGLPDSVAARSDETMIAGETMGTYYRVTVAAPHPGPRLHEDVRSILDDVDRQMSTYRPDSALSRVNKAPGQTWVPVPRPLVDVVALARSVGTASAGAFDVTAGPLVNLWGFGPADGSGKPPSPRDIAAAKELVSFGDLRIRRDPPALRKPHDAVFVDLSGIAKGYAADRISEYLGEAGMNRHLVEIGGELRAAGSNADNQPWTIAVETPSYEARRDIHKVIRLHDGGVATSGDYRNFFEHDDRRYSHIIDPRSGRPVEHDLVSATIVAPTTALADAYATAVLVSGPDEGLAMLRRRGLDGMLILRTDNGFEQLLTPGFRTLLEPRQ